MVRPIKYRIWNKLNKKMGKVLNLGLEGWWSVVEYEDGSQDSLMIPGEVPVELMQFTGLVDVDGVEIYESDILRIPDYYKEVICDDGTGPSTLEYHLSEVVFSEEHACFGVNIVNGMEYLDSGFNPLFEIFDYVNEFFEDEEIHIIGNKFTDLELLRG